MMHFFRYGLPTNKKARLQMKACCKKIFVIQLSMAPRKKMQNPVNFRGVTNLPMAQVHELLKPFKLQGDCLTIRQMIDYSPYLG